MRVIHSQSYKISYTSSSSSTNNYNPLTKTRINLKKAIHSCKEMYCSKFQRELVLFTYHITVTKSMTGLYLTRVMNMWQIKRASYLIPHNITLEILSQIEKKNKKLADKRTSIKAKDSQTKRLRGVFCLQNVNWGNENFYTIRGSFHFWKRTYTCVALFKMSCNAYQITYLAD